EQAEVARQARVARAVGIPLDLVEVLDQRDRAPAPGEGPADLAGAGPRRIRLDPDPAGERDRPAVQDDRVVAVAGDVVAQGGRGERRGRVLEGGEGRAEARPPPRLPRQALDVRL